MDTIAFAVRRKDIRHERAHKKSEGRAGHGVSSGVKERILKDGKRAKRRPPKTESRMDGVVRVVFDGIVRPSSGTRRQWDKAKRFEVNLEGGLRVALLDPEQCLHVGKHDGRYGIVYQFKEYTNGITKPYFMSRRGLLILPEVGNVREMKAEAARAVLHQCHWSHDVPQKMMKKILEPGLWGSEEFWGKMLTQYREAMLKQVVCDVMTA